VSGFGPGEVILVVSFAAESVAEVDFEPEQDANDTAKARAKAPNFNVFFIFLIVINLDFKA